MEETLVYEKLIGKTVSRVIQEDDDVLIFTFDDGATAKWHHIQNCCEGVSIDDVNGDWDDIVGSPLLVCEGRSSYGDTDYGDSETWTFYTYRTSKGSVDVKWYGSSNGYYSEGVDFEYKDEAND